MEYIQVDIIALTQSQQEESTAFALVLAESSTNRRLPIIIGMFEAQAIALELEKVQPPRPMTHDLMRDMMVEVGCRLTDILIDNLQDGTFFAKVRFSFRGTSGSLDARPSDAVALAVRFDVPIFVESSILDEAGIPVNLGPDLSNLEAFQKGLSRREIIKKALDKAVQMENYEEAARLRDDLADLNTDG